MTEATKKAKTPTLGYAIAGYRPDPRDPIQPPPRSFAVALGTSKMREPNRVSDEWTFGQLYWLYGASPNDSRRSEVPDPPCSGWSSCFARDVPERPLVQLFCPYTDKSFYASRDSYELSSYQGAFEWGDRQRANFRERLPRVWAEHRRRGWEGSDYETLAELIAVFGATVPTEEEAALLAPQSGRSRDATGAEVAPPERSIAIRQSRMQGGKPPAPSASAARPVKRAGRKGEVLAHFMAQDGHRASVDGAMAKFGVSRSNLLSVLFMLRKDHGIGYSVSGDAATVQLPEGVSDPFEKEA